MAAVLKVVPRNCLSDISRSSGFKLSKLADIKKRVRSEGLENGVFAIVSMLPHALLETLIEPLDVELSSSIKVVMQKRIREQIVDRGVATFLNLYKRSVLADLCEEIGLEVSKKQTQTDLVKAIEREIYLQGLNIFLQTLSIKVLRKMAAESVRSKDRARVSTVGSKTTLISAIHAGKLVLKSAPKKKQLRSVKSKSPILPGITYNQLYMGYTSAELRDWCSQHSLLTTGKKNAIVKRIQKFIAAEPENVTDYEPKKPIRAKKSTKSNAKTEEAAEAETDEAEDEEEEDDEVAEDEVVEDEVAEDEVVEDEVAEDEVAEDEVAEDEVVEDEVAEDEVAEDGIAEDEIAEDAEPEVSEDEVESEDDSEEVEEIDLPESLAGLKIAITGELSKPRKFYKKLIVKHGAEFMSSMSKKVDFLVAGDPTASTAKSKQADSLEIPVVGELLLSRFA